MRTIQKTFFYRTRAIRAVWMVYEYTLSPPARGATARLTGRLAKQKLKFVFTSEN